MKNHLKLSTLLLIFVFNSCSKESNVVCKTTENLGTFELQNESEDYFDYDRFNQIQMISASEMEMNLEIRDLAYEFSLEPEESCSLPCAEDERENVLTTYRRGKLGYDLIGDLSFRSKVGVIGFRVIVQRKFDPSHDDLGSEDVIEIFPLIASSNVNGYAVGDSSVFTMILWKNHGMDLGPELNIKHDVVKFRTRWYNDVYEGPLSNEGIRLYVKKGLGIVAIESNTHGQVYLRGLR